MEKPDQSEFNDSYVFDFYNCKNRKMLNLFFYIFFIQQPKSYPTEERPRKYKTNKTVFNKHKHSLRKSITPGTVLILVAGRHAGKVSTFLFNFLLNA